MGYAVGYAVGKSVGKTVGYAVGYTVFEEPQEPARHITMVGYFNL